MKWEKYSNIPLKTDTFHRKKEVGEYLLAHYIASKKKKAKLLFYKIAASIAILAGSAISYYQANEKSLKTGYYSRIHTLPDGSVVEIYPDSKIKYNSLVWNFERKVSMEGTAKFNVVKSESTFLVQAGKLKVKVLGTIFKIAESNSSTQVDCFEGRVEVKDEALKQILEKGDMINISGKKHTIKLHSDSNQNAIEQNINPILISAMPLSDLDDKLSEIYNQRFFADESCAEILYSGALLLDDMNTTLELIVSSCDLKLERDNGIIKLYKTN